MDYVNGIYAIKGLFLHYLFLYCGSHGLKHLLIGWKPEPAFLCDAAVIDPNGEFSRLAAGCFCIDAEFFFEQRCYPSSAGRIRRSNQAVSNYDLHKRSIILLWWIVTR